jgi:superfamily II DNA or RNA helicase
MKVRKFTSSENREEREEIRRDFASGDKLQVITAIKCLDEGVNIPAIKKAFILASSTNPKEYIQRRGRVLRKAAGKTHAEIYDFITLPRPLKDVKFCSPQELEYDLTLVRKEFERMMDFAATSNNPFAIDSIKEEIQTTYNNMLNGGCIDE